MSATSLTPFLDPRSDPMLHVYPNNLNKSDVDELRCSLDASDSSIQSKMALRVQSQKPSQLESLLGRLQDEGCYYADSEAAALSLFQDRMKTLAVWQRKTFDREIFGVFLRPFGGSREIFYNATPEQLVYIVRCHKTLVDLATRDAVAQDYEGAVAKLKADHKKTIVAWLSKEALYQTFSLILRIDATDNPNFRPIAKIVFKNFPLLVKDHFQEIEARGVLNQKNLFACQTPKLATEEEELFQRLKKRGNLFTDRSVALAGLQKDPSLAFAVWKRVTTESQKYGLLIHVIANDKTPAFKLKLQQLISDVESAEVVRALLSQGIFAGNRASALQVMENKPETTLVAWTSNKNGFRVYNLLTRLPTDPPGISNEINNIVLKDFAPKVRDHNGAVSFIEHMKIKRRESATKSKEQ